MLVECAMFVITDAPKYRNCTGLRLDVATARMIVDVSQELHDVKYTSTEFASEHSFRLALIRKIKSKPLIF